MDRGAWRAMVHGATESWTQPKQLSKWEINQYFQNYIQGIKKDTDNSQNGLSPWGDVKSTYDGSRQWGGVKLDSTSHRPESEPLSASPAGCPRVSSKSDLCVRASLNEVTILSDNSALQVAPGAITRPMTKTVDKKTLSLPSGTHSPARGSTENVIITNISEREE